MDLDVFGEAEFAAVEAGEDAHLVAATDVHVLADGAEAVGGVGVAAVLGVPLQAPEALVGILLEVPSAQVVDVGAFAVNERAEDALAHHVEGEHLAVAVAAVFQEHAVDAVLFGQVDDVPAVFHVENHRHFAGHVLFVAEGVLHHLHVHLPRRGDVDEVDVRVVNELFPFLRATIVALGGGETVVGEPLRGSRDTRLEEVAERRHAHAGDGGKTIDRAGATHAQANHADLDGLERGASQTTHVLKLPGGQFARDRPGDGCGTGRLQKAAACRKKTHVSCSLLSVLTA